MKVKSLIQALMTMPQEANCEFVLGHETGETFLNMDGVKLQKETHVHDSTKDGEPLAVDLVVSSREECRIYLTT